MRTITSLASMTVPTPTVRAYNSKNFPFFLSHVYRICFVNFYLLGHFAHVSPEKSCIRKNRVLIEGFDSSSRNQRRTGLIECNVSVRTDAANEELDSSGILNQLFIALALRLQIRRIAIQNMSVVWINVDMLQNMELENHFTVVICVP